MVSIARLSRDLILLLFFVLLDELVECDGDGFLYADGMGSIYSNVTEGVGDRLIAELPMLAVGCHSFAGSGLT